MAAMENGPDSVGTPDGAASWRIGVDTLMALHHVMGHLANLRPVDRLWVLDSARELARTWQNTDPHGTARPSLARLRPAKASLPVFPKGER